MGSAVIGIGMRAITSNRLVGAGALIIAVAFATLAAATLWPQPGTRELAATTPAQEEGGVEAALRSGLPLPRFVSLKTVRANVRRGPGKDYPIAFQFQRRALPVEIVREFENWRLIRDAEGEEGWIHHALLSGARTAAVAPWDRSETLQPLRDRDRPDAEIVARIEPQVVVHLVSCDGTWCAVNVDGRSGFVEQKILWGVYPDERIE